MTPSPDDLRTILFRATDKDVPLGAILTFDRGAAVRRATLTVGGGKVATIWLAGEKPEYLVPNDLLFKADVIGAILCRIAAKCCERKAREAASAAKMLDKIAESISPPEIIGRVDDLDDGETAGTIGFAAAHDDLTGDDTEIIYRSAPRWAWEIMDETLALDAKSGAFDFDLRQSIADATAAMILSCERADDAAISREDVADFRDVDGPGYDIASLVMFGQRPGSRA